MNFKVPVESESYKEDSEFVIEQITQILDRQRQKGDNRIVINTNLRMGLPLENINKIGGTRTFRNGRYHIAVQEM